MVRNSPYCPSLPSAPGRIRKTNGSRRPSGIASRSFALASPNTSSRPPRRVRTSSLKAALSAQPTISRTAKARKPRPRKSSRGPFAPMSSASWIGRTLNRKRPAHSPAKLRLPTRRRSENCFAKGLRLCRSPFLFAERQTACCSSPVASCEVSVVHDHGQLSKLHTNAGSRANFCDRRHLCPPNGGSNLGRGCPPLRHLCHLCACDRRRS
jgi:hypothetical protein